jgi:hypothetical protein
MTRGGPGAATGPGGGSWSHEARGGSEAALCQEMGAAGHTGIWRFRSCRGPWWRELEAHGVSRAALYQETGAVRHACMCVCLTFHL